MIRTMKVLLALLAVLALLLCFGAALGETVGISYVNARGVRQMPVKCTVVTSGEFATWTGGWYAVTENGVKVSGGKSDTPSVTVSGNVNLILCDGASLETANGIYVPQGCSLTIWAQSTGDKMGGLAAYSKVNSYSDGMNAGIGGIEDKVAGAIIINGGSIQCYVAKAAGIGGGNGHASGYTSIEINGGRVISYGGGGGYYGAAAGIGAGRNNDNTGKITITGGYVDAKGSREYPAIGTPENSGEVVITGGKVEAKTRYSGAGYGNEMGGSGISSHTITISADTAVEGDYVKAIGVKGYSGIHGTKITITGGNIEASASGEESKGAGISVPGGDSGASITIRGGTVNATGRMGAGIGTRKSNHLEGTIKISGGTVNAISMEHGAGIGSGYGGNAKEGHIIITGGTVSAKGGKMAAGIGGGAEYDSFYYKGPGGEGCGDVQILGGTVFAQSGGGSSSAIGHGDNDSYMGSITFGPDMCVKAGNELDGIDGTYEGLFSAGLREEACKWRHKALIQACDHQADVNYAYIGADGHLRDSCPYCGKIYLQESHVFDDATHTCRICGYTYGGELVTVSFDANGGSGTMKSITYMPETIYIPPRCGFRPPAGKVFQEWLVSAAGTTAEDPVSGLHFPGEPFILPGGGDVKLIAQWEGNSTVTISPGIGTGENQSLRLSGGERYPLPTLDDLGYEGPEWFAFAGWQINADRDNLVQPLAEITIKGDTAITAIWTRAARTVTFDTNGGSAAAAQTVQNGETAVRPADPVRNGDTFVDWYLGDEVFDFTTPVTRDLTLTAWWRQDLVAHTVTFTDGLGNVLAAQIVADGSPAEAPADPVRDGYIFDGWDTDFNNVTSDLTVTARWKQAVMTHTVTFEDGQGNVLDTQAVADGMSAAAPEDPAREGFIFSGWDTDFSSVTEDLTVKARWTEVSPEEDKYTVVFVFGFGLDPVSQVVNPGESATAPDIPEVDGFTFAGWDKEFTSITDNLTVTAQWKKNTAGNMHTVVFVDGYSYNPLLIQRVPDGRAATPPADPEREGYTFDGWDTDFSNVTSDLTVIARWKQIIVTHTVTFEDGLGNVLDTQTVIDGMPADAPEDPAREGYTFDGWDTYFSNVTSDLTVTARWKQVIVTHTVTFEDGQGNVLDTQTVIDGTPAAAPEDPTKEGFIFSGWDTDFSSVKADLTVKALWTEASPEEDKFTVVFVFGFGLDPVSQTVNQGESAAAPAVPEVDGFTFAGWDKEFTNITDNLTVTAQWKKNTAGNAHTVVFVDGYSVNPLLIQRVPDGRAATPPADPTREGYTFTGWDTDFSSVTSDLTVIAGWKQAIVTHTVTFTDGLGNVLAVRTVIDGLPASAPEDPIREGYTFDGWDTDFSSITSDLTVTAGWKQVIVTHTVAFEDGLGNVLDTQTVADGMSAAAPEAPARDGFIFSGWDTDFSSVKADLTVKARWTEVTPEEDKYTVVFVFGFGLDPVSQVVNQGESAEAPVVPEVDGFTFTGWDKEITNITDNMTVTAQWKKNTAGNMHTVVFVDGYSVNPLLIQRVPDGQAATPPADPEREGYSFTGWDTDFSCVTSDLTVIARWEQKAAVVARAPLAKDLIYNGYSQELVAAGTAIGGTMQYAIGTGTTEAPVRGWSAAIPAGTGAGTYYVWYKAAGNAEHTDSEPACVPVTIREAEKKAIRAAVTFRVVHGAWGDGTTADKTVILAGYEGDELRLRLEDIPDVDKPDEGYEGETGKWSPKEPPFYMDGEGYGDPITQDTVFTFAYGVKASYALVSAENPEHTVGDGENTVLTFKRNIEDEKTFGKYQSTQMDGKGMPAASHTVKEGSLILTLNSAYLDTLSVGKHKVTVKFEDGEAEAVVTITAAPPVPKTGDHGNPALWIGLMTLGLIGIGGMAVSRRRHS